MVTLAPEDAFQALPAGLRNDLLGSFQEIVRNFSERRWEPAELNGGKLCEAAFSVVRGLADNSMPQRASKPPNMVDACRAMERETALPRSVRIQIPRMILALYEVRNNRGVGHAGGDVDPNEMDATAVLYMSKWIVAELVRVLHTVSTEDASAIVEAIIERQSPLIWRSGDIRRVLRTDLTRKQNSLLLMLSEPGGVSEADLVRWLEHPSVATYRRDVLRPGHKQRLWEYDELEQRVTLLPPGVKAAESIVQAVS